MRQVERHKRCPDSPDAIKESGTGRSWWAARLEARASKDTETMPACNKLLRHGKNGRNVATALKHDKEKPDRSH
ncbi:MAG: hypothetical protein A49_16030 [Methyloceanibacter sp.]|nr:MAG: hypothetical protein A49_16030 [Methyloceanibacter sp.]